MIKWIKRGLDNERQCLENIESLYENFPETMSGHAFIWFTHGMLFSFLVGITCFFIFEVVI